MNRQKANLRAGCMDLKIARIRVEGVLQFKLSFRIVPTYSYKLNLRSRAYLFNWVKDRKIICYD